MRDSVCEGFVWIGQSMLCCDNCGWPWFLHAGDASIFGGETPVVPFPEAQQAQIPDMLAAWEANALWQAERGAWRFDWNDRSKGSYAPDVERQVGRELPADRDKALAAIAAGWGRTATAAHPDCSCMANGTARNCPQRSKKPMEPPDTATTRCAAPAPHSGEVQHRNEPQNDAETGAG